MEQAEAHGAVEAVVTDEVVGGAAVSCAATGATRLAGAAFWPQLVRVQRRRFHQADGPETGAQVVGHLFAPVGADVQHADGRHAEPVEQAGQPRERPRLPGRHVDAASQQHRTGRVRRCGYVGQLDRHRGTGTSEPYPRRIDAPMIPPVVELPVPIDGRR